MTDESGRDDVETRSYREERRGGDRMADPPRSMSDHSLGATARGAIGRARSPRPPVPEESPIAAHLRALAEQRAGEPNG